MERELLLRILWDLRITEGYDSRERISEEIHNMSDEELMYEIKCRNED